MYYVVLGDARWRGKKLFEIKASMMTKVNCKKIRHKRETSSEKGREREREWEEYLITIELW